MRFLCNNCKAKYQIADEKLSGRKVRMKCRKCGHIIEVPSVGQARGPAKPSVAPTPAPAPRAPMPTDPSKMAPPRPARASIPGAPPIARPSRPSVPGPAPSAPDPSGGGLAGAFSRSVGDPSDQEVSAAIEVLSAGAAEEWYVGVNGVPLGPVRLSHLRQKAAQGVITGDSLVWREGFEEWVPLRTFPELATLVNETREQAMRGSVAPSARGSYVPPAPPPPPATRRGPASPSPPPQPAAPIAAAAGAAPPIARPSPAIAQPGSAAIARPSPAIAQPGSAAIARPSPAIAQPGIARPSPAIAQPGSAAIARPSPAIAQPGSAAMARPGSAAAIRPSTPSPQVAPPPPAAVDLARPSPQPAPERSLSRPAIPPGPSVADPQPSKPPVEVFSDPFAGGANASAQKAEVASDPFATSGSAAVSPPSDPFAPKAEFAAPTPGPKPRPSQFGSPVAPAEVIAPPPAPVGAATGEAPMLSPAIPTPAPTPFPPAEELEPRRSIVDDLAVGVRRQVRLHPAAYVLIAIGAGFGITAAAVMFWPDRGPAPAPTIRVVTVNAPIKGPPGETPEPGSSGDLPEIGINGEPVARVPGKLGGGSPVAEKGSTPEGKGPGKSTFGLGNGPSVEGPKVGGGSGTQSGGGGQLSASDIERVVASQKALVKRGCWEPALASRAHNAPKCANVGVSVSISPSGRVSSASAGGGNGYPGLASCVQGRVRGWTFPRSGGQSQVNIPFKFCAQ